MIRIFQDIDALGGHSEFQTAPDFQSLKQEIFPADATLIHIDRCVLDQPVHHQLPERNLHGKASVPAALPGHVYRICAVADLVNLRIVQSQRLFSGKLLQIFLQNHLRCLWRDEVPLVIICIIPTCQVFYIQAAVFPCLL